MNVPLIGKVGRYTLSAVTWASVSAFFIMAAVTDSVTGKLGATSVVAGALCGAKALSKIPEALIEMRSGY